MHLLNDGAYGKISDKETRADARLLLVYGKEPTARHGRAGRDAG